MRRHLRQRKEAAVRHPLRDYPYRPYPHTSSSSRSQPSLFSRLLMLSQSNCSSFLVSIISTQPDFEDHILFYRFVGLLSLDCILMLSSHTLLFVIYHLWLYRSMIIYLKEDVRVINKKELLSLNKIHTRRKRDSIKLQQIVKFKFQMVSR